MAGSLVVLARGNAVLGRAPSAFEQGARVQPVQVEALQALRSLQPLPQLDQGKPLAGGQSAERSSREADSLEQRLEPVGQLELVPLVAAEELDARQPVL